MTEKQKKQIDVCRQNGLTISATAAATGLSVSAIKSYCSRRNNSEQPSDFHCKFCGAALMQTEKRREKHVWDTEIWQNLREDERGWHAADGSTRRSSQRKDGSTIGGNLDTIAIECIGDRKLSEDTTAKLVAWLCKKHGLDPKTDVYTHKYFYARKQCPQYILPHWNTFLSTVQKYYNALTGKAITPKAEAVGRTYTVKHGDTLWQIAQTYLGKGSRYTEIVKLNGLKSNVLKTGQVLVLPEK